MTGPWGIAAGALGVVAAGVHFVAHAICHKKTPDMLHVVTSALFGASIVEATNLLVLILLPAPGSPPVDMRDHPLDGCIAALAILLVGVYGLIENANRIRDGLKRQPAPPKNES